MSTTVLDPLLEAPPVPPVAEGIPKLVHLQILRALAASMVVVDHAFSFLQPLGFPCERFVHPGFLVGSSGVSVFFVLSGVIMMRQSAHRFGRKRSAIQFAYRRVTRIVPMYWIATFALIAMTALTRKPLPIQGLFRSLFFIPNYLANGARLMPVLGPGWTLNYEMFFYLMFALAMLLPRRKGVLALVLVPQLLVAAARAHSFPASGSILALVHFYTDPLILLFSYGVLIGFFEVEVKYLSRFASRISPAYLLLAFPALCLAFPHRVGAPNFFDLIGILSVLIVLLCTLTTDKSLGPVGRALVLLGDASYSTYLFHVFASLWLLQAAVAILGRHARSLPIAIFLVPCTVVAANLLGLLIHIYVERPIIGFFRRRDLGSAKPSAV